MNPLSSLDKELRLHYTKAGYYLEEKLSPRGLWGVKWLLTDIGTFAVYYFLYSHGVDNDISVKTGSLTVAPERLGNLSNMISSDPKYYNSSGIAIEGEEKSIDKLEWAYLNCYNRPARLPLFLSGSYFVLSSLYNVGQSLFHGEPLKQDISENLFIGVGFLSLASSFYLNDRNPLLLKKATVWRRAYNWLKEKTPSLIPQLPKPLPIPESG